VIPAAAAAVIAAAIEDAARRGHTPQQAAARAARELRRAGWTITPTGAATGRQAPAQRAA
jgi:hypothetical protein